MIWWSSYCRFNNNQNWMINVISMHGRRSSKWFGGHQSFARKMTWKLPDKSIFFFCPNYGDLQKKKRSSLNLGRFFCPDWGDLQKKKRSSLTLRRFFYPAFGIFSQTKLAQTTWQCLKFWRDITQKLWNCQKFWRKIAQNIWNCPKLRHLTPTGGANTPCPPHLLCLCIHGTINYITLWIPLYSYSWVINPYPCCTGK